jgi:hypothetical protein
MTGYDQAGNQPSPRPGLLARTTPTASPRVDAGPLPRPLDPLAQAGPAASGPEHSHTPSMELAMPLLSPQQQAAQQAQQRQQGGDSSSAAMQKHDSSSSIPQPAGLKAVRTSQQQAQQQAASSSMPADAEGLLAAFMARLSAESTGSPPTSAKFGAQQNLAAWLDEPDSALHPERSRASFDPFSTFLSARDTTPAASFSGGDTAHVMEAKRKVGASCRACCCCA